MADDLRRERRWNGIEADLAARGIAVVLVNRNGGFIVPTTAHETIETHTSNSLNTHFQLVDRG